VPVATSVQTYPLARANDALADLRHGRLRGAAVLIPWRRPGTSRAAQSKAKKIHGRRRPPTISAGQSA